MTTESSFETAWVRKFCDAMESVCGPDAAARIQGGICPGDEVRWTVSTMRDLVEVAGPEKAAEVLTRCACRYPEDGLTEARTAWESTGDVDSALELLQAGFDRFLEDDLDLTPEEIAFVHGRQMGPAGVREGNTILATKIPKSGFLRKYIAETDPERRRLIYCHCPRIRDAVAEGNEIPPVYCYCGAGFYRSIWERILGVSVEVEVLDSILDGGDACRIAVHLPPGTVE